MAEGYLAGLHEFDRSRGFNVGRSCPCAQNEEQDILATLMLFLESLIKETPSPDVISLALMATEKRAREMGIDDSVRERTIVRMVAYVREQQQAHPFASMF